MEKIYIPSSREKSEFQEKKSRFISLCIPVENAEQVRSLLKETRTSHPQSRHVVWAYLLGDARSVFGMSDDGEPHGTAGKPVLEVLKGSGMTNLLVLVIRYFGELNSEQVDLSVPIQELPGMFWKRLSLLKKYLVRSFRSFVPITFTNR